MVQVLESPAVGDGSAPDDGPSEGEARVYRLAEGTELIGEYQDAGYEVPKYLVRRADGQVMQLPLLLYRVAGSLDGRPTQQIAGELSLELGRDLTADDVVFLVENKLSLVGLVATDEPTGQQDAEPGSARPSDPPVRSDPLLALRYRVGVIPAGAVWRIGGIFRPLFFRPVWLAALALFIGLSWAILQQSSPLDQVLAGLRQVIHQPVLILVIIGLQALSGCFHECGHVTACRYGGGRPGDMGIGLFIVWPAFYSTVTDSYRLNRIGRLRTDLGGVYFNTLFMSALAGLYLYTGQPWLLLAVIGMFSETLYQFFPSLRLDGYYILADLVGVPDLFQYIGPVLSGVLPGRATHPRVRELRPWRRRLIVLWVTLSIPVLLGFLAIFVIAAPKIIPLLWPTVVEYLQTVDDAARGADVVSTALGVLQLLFLVLPWVGTALITWSIVNLVRRLAVKRWGRGRVEAATWARIRRGLATAGLVGLASGVVYRVWTVAASLPASPGEARLVNSAVASIQGVPTASPVPADLWFAQEQLLGYARLTGAFGRHASVLTGARELAVLASAVLLSCLVLLAQRRRARPMAVAVVLLVTVLMGPAVQTLARFGPGLLGAAWAAVGICLLRQSRHLPRVRPARVVGGLALLAGIVTEPLLAVPLAAAVIAGLADHRRSVPTAAPTVAARHTWGPAVLVAVSVGVVALAGADGDPGPLAAPDLTVLVLFGAIVVVAAALVRSLRPLLAAASCVLLLAVLPWPGAGRVVPLALVAVMFLLARLVHVASTQPAHLRPHPLLRAGIVVPGVVVALVGLLFLPPRLADPPHRALATWLEGPTSPAGPVAVPAAFWGDLVRDGVPTSRMVLADSTAGRRAAWTVCAGRAPAGSGLPACIADGAGALAVQMTPQGWAQARQAQARAQEQNRLADAQRQAQASQDAANQAFGVAVAQSPRVSAPADVRDALAQGDVDPRAVAVLMVLTTQGHTLSLAPFPASDVAATDGRIHAITISRLDGQAASRRDVATRLGDLLSGQPPDIAPAEVVDSPDGVTATWESTDPVEQAGG